MDNQGKARRRHGAQDSHRFYLLALLAVMELGLLLRVCQAKFYMQTGKIHLAIQQGIIKIASKFGTQLLNSIISLLKILA
jgi:hypothetical protein